jgi:hypothetical protein
MSKSSPDSSDCSSGIGSPLGNTPAPPAVAVVGQAAAGRHCPVSYHYGPAVFRRTPDILANTIYVVGGLYGNRHALDQIETLMVLEARHRPLPMLVFNGDFHWLDIEPPVFNEINRRVLNHIALRGNVETELAGSGNNGCGCAYPDEVDDDEVARSNEILRHLQAVARRSPATGTVLSALPMHAVAKVGEARIAIVHGDADTLAGWGFDQRRLRDPAGQLALHATFREAEVDIFASSHTCLPALHQLTVDGTHRAVINNGAAGLPNFHGARHGVITRIATTPTPRELPVLHEVSWHVNGERVHVAAVAVCYDDTAWRQQFQKDWPAGSPAHRSYWQRIHEGPNYRIDQAY